MKSKRPLSVIPYYGGKAKMADFISKRLDYSVKTFVTIFGGGCRVLLNKEPHLVEYYNEYDSGLVALMGTLANPDTAEELIDKLYYETEPTKDQFLKAKELYDNCKLDLEEQHREPLKQFLKDHGIVGKLEMNEWLEKAFDLAMANMMPEEVLKKQFDDKEPINKEEYGRFKDIFAPWVVFKKLKEDGDLLRSRDMHDEVISDMELAMATYLTYTLSYSAMGGHYSNGKFKTFDQYKSHVLNLRKCADRLNGVNILQLDAMSFFRDMEYYKQLMKPENETNESMEPDTLFKWLLDPDVQILADPSYISPVDEERILHNPDKNIDININAVNIDKGETVSAIIEKEWHGKEMPKDLGSVYARSFGYEEQEVFLRGIQNAKCKFLVCNYDLELYNRYLTPEKGWYKEIYPTTTSVFNASNTNKSKERLEVIWRNY